MADTRRSSRRSRKNERALIYPELISRSYLVIVRLRDTMSRYSSWLVSLIDWVIIFYHPHENAGQIKTYVFPKTAR